MMYFRGDGVQKDYQKAYAWVDLSAKNGAAGYARVRDEIATELSPEALQQARQLAEDLYGLAGQDAVTIPPAGARPVPPASKAPGDASAHTKSNSSLTEKTLPGDDGLRILFTSTRDGEFGTFVMDAAGASVTRLTGARPSSGLKRVRSDTDGKLYVERTDGAKSAPINSVGDCVSVSPDGNKIAFQSRDARPYPLVVMNFDGSQAKTIVRSMWTYTPVFSPDGTKIAFMGYKNDFEIFVVNTDGTNLQRLTYAPGRDGGLAQGAWSPDGSKLTFMSERDAGKPREVYVMNADGTGQTRLTSGGWPGWVVMGPDGTYRPRAGLPGRTR
jgi:WD40 repeat protein